MKNVCRLITWELYRPSTTGEGESRDVREQRFSDYLHQIVTETEAAARVTIDSKDVNEDESVSEELGSQIMYFAESPATGVNRHVPPYNRHLTALFGCNCSVNPLFNDENAKLCAYYILKYVAKVSWLLSNFKHNLDNATLNIVLVISTADRTNKT